MASGQSDNNWNPELLNWWRNVENKFLYLQKIWNLKTFIFHNFSFRSIKHTKQIILNYKENHRFFYFQEKDSTDIQTHVKNNKNSD